MYRLIPDFRLCGPLDRSASEIEALLQGAPGAGRARATFRRGPATTRGRACTRIRASRSSCSTGPPARSRPSTITAVSTAGCTCSRARSTSTITRASTRATCRVTRTSSPRDRAASGWANSTVARGRTTSIASPLPEMRRRSRSTSTPAHCSQYLVYDEDARRCQAAFGRYDAILSGDLTVAG